MINYKLLPAFLIYAHTFPKESLLLKNFQENKISFKFNNDNSHQDLVVYVENNFL